MYSRMKKDGYDVEDIKSQMRDIVVKTLMGVLPDLSHHYRTS